MRISLLYYALVLLIIGVMLTITIIGAIIGIPLLFLALIFFVIGCFLPESRKEIIVKIEKGKSKNK